MQYDIASKVILSHCKKAVLQELCGLRVKDAELIEVRLQETASLRRSDFVLKALFEDGTEKMVLLELITAWKKYLPLRTLETRCCYLLEEGSLLSHLRKYPPLLSTLYTHYFSKFNLN